MERVNTDPVLAPQKKPSLYEPLCTLVTQLLNPVRPKWLRPSRHPELAAPHSDCLRGHCARHMLAVSLSPHIHMCCNLSKVVGACTSRRGRPDAPRELNRSVAPSDIYPCWYPHSFFLLVKLTNGVDFRGFRACSCRHSWEGCGWRCLVSCSLSSCPNPLNMIS